MCSLLPGREDENSFLVTSEHGFGPGDIDVTTKVKEVVVSGQQAWKVKAVLHALPFGPCAGVCVQSALLAWADPHVQSAVQGAAAWSCQCCPSAPPAQLLFEHTCLGAQAPEETLTAITLAPAPAESAAQSYHASPAACRPPQISHKRLRCGSALPSACEQFRREASQRRTGQRLHSSPRRQVDITC